MPQRLIRAAAVLAAAGALAACSTPNAAPEAPAAAQAQAQATEDGPATDSVTGSRIPRKSTDRLLRQTGNKGAVEAERDRPPNPGPRVQ